MTVVDVTPATNRSEPSDNSYSPSYTSQAYCDGVQGRATAHAWAHAFHQLRGESVDSAEEREADKERIACLEAIISVLIEKNERMRQQLLESLR